jgi:hypothetical protein
MAFYVRAKTKEKAQEMLEKLLKEYSKDIECYDIEIQEYDLSNLPKDVAIEIRKVSRRGGSISFNFPSSVAKYLGLNVGDHLAIVVNKSSGRIYLSRIRKVETSSKISLA